MSSTINAAPGTPMTMFSNLQIDAVCMQRRTKRDGFDQAKIFTIVTLYRRFRDFLVVFMQR
jgi:hypothetical protein